MDKQTYKQTNTQNRHGTCLCVKNYFEQKSARQRLHFKSGTEMAVNFSRIVQDEAKLLDQVQNYPEKMAGLIFDPNISGAG